MMTMATPEPPVERADPWDEAVAPVGSADLDDIADGIEHPLDPRAVAVQRITGWIVFGPSLAGLLLALLLVVILAPLPGWGKALLVLPGIAAMAGLAWLAHRWPEIEHRHTFYKVDGRGIEMRRGVLWRKVINVPRSRVQHTDVSQGPLERGHGLATLVLFTAGTDHARVTLHGLDRATALRIRDHLLVGEGDDAV